MANLSNINNYFVVDTTGKVAIGDVSAATIPTLLTQLTLYDNTATASLVIQSGAASGKKYELGSSSTGKFQITDLDAGLDRLTVATNGRIGIGTSNPVALLVLSQANGANIRFENQTTSRVCTVGEGVGTNDVFSFRGNSYRSTDTLSVVFSTDRVGIGIITPNEKLQVAGNIHAYAPNGIDAGLFASTAAGNTTAAVRSSGVTHFNGGNVGIGTSSPTSPASVAKFLEIQGSTAGIVLHDDGNDPYEIWASGGNLVFRYNNTQGENGMLLSSTGNLGIGSTSPEAKLDISNVAGGTYALEISTPERNRALFYYNSASTSDAGYLGIKRGSVDALNHRFATTGNSAVCIEEGNFGIGTDSPTYKLHIDSDDANDDVVFIHHDNPSQSSGTLLKIRTDAGDSNGYTLLDVQTNNGSALFVRGDRNVGIGTTSPGNLLDVAGDTDISGQLFVQHSGGYTAKLKQLATSMSNATYTFEIDSTAHTSNLSTAGAMSVDVDSGRAFTINGLGNVGIGTNSPGNVRLFVENTSASTNPVFKTKLDTTYSMGMTNEWVSQYVSKIKIGRLSAPTSSMDFIYDISGTEYGSIKRNYGASSLKFERGTAVDMLINGSGNVGIGTTSPRAKLEVDGELIVKDIKHSNFAVASLNTTGYTIATVTGAGNGSSAQIEFIGMGGTSGIVDVVYSCTNQGGNWYAYKKARQTPTIVDVDVTGHGTTTLSFVFKSLSSSGAAYTPRLMMKGSPSSLVTF